MWGRIEIHEGGLRAQFARPLAIVKDDLPLPAQVQIAATYAVPVVDEADLPRTASEWGKVVPCGERAYCPADLLTDVLERSGLGAGFAPPRHTTELMRLLLGLLGSVIGTGHAIPRAGESWTSWWCRLCDAAAVGRAHGLPGAQMATVMASLPTSEEPLDEPRVCPPMSVLASPAAVLSPGGQHSLTELLENVVVGLECEPTPIPRRGSLPWQSAPLTVADNRWKKRITRPLDVAAMLALPAARGWCTADEQRLAVDVALQEDAQRLLGLAVPLVADLLPRERLVTILAASERSKTITGALRRLGPEAARSVADATLIRATNLSMHADSLGAATESVARDALARCLPENTYLLRYEPVRELIAAEARDEMLLNAAGQDEDPAARLSSYSALSEAVAPKYIEALLAETADIPRDAWIRMCRGLSRVPGLVLDSVDDGVLASVAKRLLRYPEEAAELLTAWSSAPTELSQQAFHARGTIGGWRRVRLLRRHPESIDSSDAPILKDCDATPLRPAPDVERLLALLVAAPQSAEVEYAAQRVAGDRQARVDLRVAAFWRCRVDGWDVSDAGREAAPEVLRLFLESACFRRAGEFSDPLNWRDTGLTTPMPPAGHSLSSGAT